MNEPPDLAQKRLDPAVGAACHQRLELLLHRVQTASPADRPRRLAEVHASLRALRPALEAYAAHQIKARNLAPSSTALALLERFLSFAHHGVDGDLEDREDEASSPPEPPDRPGETPEERLAREDAELERRDEEESRAAAEFAALIESIETDEAREIERAIRPADPFAALPAGPWSARFHRVASCQGEEVAAVRLAGPAGAWVVHLAGFGELRGRASLTDARLVPIDHGLALQGAEGTLQIHGQAWVEPEHSPPPPLPSPAHADRAAWVALIDQINARARWDYEIEEWKPPPGQSGISIRGKSGHYDPGCAIRLTGVTAFDLPHAFHHAVFRLLDPSALPDDARPAAGVALGIEAEVSFGDPRTRFVIATAARYEDDEILCEAPALRDEPEPPPLAPWPPRPLALVRAALPGATGLRAALRALLDAPPAAFDAPSTPAALAARHAREALIASEVSADYRALLASPSFRGAPFDASPRAPGAPPGALPPDALTREILAVLSSREPLAAPVSGGLSGRSQPSGGVDARLTAPLAPAPVREAAVRAAHAWLSDAFASLETEALDLAEADLALLGGTLVAPSTRILGDARQLAAEAVARRPLGLADRAVALDLDHLTVGRVLFDPVAEASRPEEERLVRAAGLLALDAARAPDALSIARMLPDPAARARMIAAVPLLVRSGPAIDQLTTELAARSRLDAHEVTLLLDEETRALRLYRLLRAALLGDPAAR
jgi:hypothetical protein